MQRRLQAPPALPSQEMTEANPAALAERAGDTALDFLTAEAPLCDRSATYRGLQGRGLSLDPHFLTARAPTFVAALAERAGDTALDPPTFLPRERPLPGASRSTPPPGFFVSVHSAWVTWSFSVSAH